MSQKNSATPDHIDAPKATYFKVGVERYERPFRGSENLVVLAQDFCSVDGTFPKYGENHPNNTSFFLFHISPHSDLGAGLKRATCFFAKIKNGLTETFKQQVQFFGVRMRSVKFQETYLEIKRLSSFRTITVNGAFGSVPYVKNVKVSKGRTLETFDMIAREPFGQEVSCTKHIEFVNLAQENIPDSFIKEKIIVTDKNNAQWKKDIEDAYEKLKHPDTTGYTIPQIPSGFSTKIATNYLSETSSPSLDWYMGKIGQKEMIVSPSVVEPFFGGKLMKIEWVTTEYK